VSGQLHTTAALYAGKSPWHPSYTRLGGPHSQSGRSEIEKKILSLPGIKTPVVQHFAITKQIKFQSYSLDKFRRVSILFISDLFVRKRFYSEILATSLVSHTVLQVSTPSQQTWIHICAHGLANSDRSSVFCVPANVWGIPQTSLLYKYIFGRCDLYLSYLVYDQRKITTFPERYIRYKVHCTPTVHLLLRNLSFSIKHSRDPKMNCSVYSRYYATTAR
jgi:hypothetical protein